MRSLTRLKMMTDELRMRASTSRKIGIETPERARLPTEARGRILLVDDRAVVLRAVRSGAARPRTTVDVETNPQEALFQAAEGNLRPADRLARP